MQFEWSNFVLCPCGCNQSFLFFFFFCSSATEPYTLNGIYKFSACFPIAFHDDVDKKKTSKSTQQRVATERCKSIGELRPTLGYCCGIFRRRFFIACQWISDCWWCCCLAVAHFFFFLFSVLIVFFFFILIRFVLSNECCGSRVGST